MTTQTNSPESQWLNADDRQLFDNARSALDSLRKTFEAWVVIGRAVVRAKEIADERGGRFTFKRLLDQQGLSELVGDKASLSRLLQIMARLPEVEEWRLTLNDRQRIDWSAPNTVFKRCPIFSKRDGDNPPEPRLAAVTILKRQTEEYSREIAHLKEQLAAVDGGNHFDLKLDSAANIANAIFENVSRNKASEIAQHLTKLIKAKKAA